MKRYLRIAAALTVLVATAVLSTDGMAAICWMPGAVSDHECCDHTVPALQRPSACPSMGDGVDEVASVPFQLLTPPATPQAIPVVEDVLARAASADIGVLRAEPRAPPRPHRIVFCSYLI